LTRHAVERQIAANHPAAAGHFPGNPIVPGAVILAEVIAAISVGRSVAAFEVVSAKFLDKMRPGERLVIRWDETQEGEVRFTCSAGATDRPVAAGSVRLGASA
jgi:3-hydroxymyristoyl/3-hydroxydecanoyl-(acyl carrier protein) dehydratase